MKVNIFIAVSIVTCLILSCKKEQPVYISSTSLTLVNAISDDMVTIVPNFNANVQLGSFIQADTIKSGNFHIYGGYNGLIPLAVYDYRDSVHSILQQNIQIDPQSVQSLFITGQLSKPETLLTADTVLKFNAADSLIGVRFVNMCTGAGKIKINLQEDPGKVIFKSLPYRSTTSFQPFSVKDKDVPSKSYVFEVRDANSSALITQMPINLVGAINNEESILHSKCVTILIAGTVDTPIGIKVNNY